jgi:hypothetical protein
MVSRNELDEAFDVYRQSRSYIEKIDDIALDAYVEEEIANIPGSASKGLRELLKRDVKKITDIINALKVIHKAYKIGNDETKRYINGELFRITNCRYNPEGGKIYNDYLEREITGLRLRKDALEYMLKEADAQYVPPIPRKAKRSSAKTRFRKTPTKQTTPQAKRFGEGVISKAMRIGGFTR